MGALACGQITSDQNGRQDHVRKKQQKNGIGGGAPLTLKRLDCSQERNFLLKPTKGSKKIAAYLAARSLSAYCAICAIE